MIFYFSATGNCKYVAQSIATAIGDTSCSIEGITFKKTFSENEVFGLVTPTYSWELPLIVRRFLEKLEITGHRPSYIFVVATYGTTPGAAGADAAHILMKRGLPVSAKFSIQMPDTWTPIFDLSDPEKVKKQNERADGQLREVIQNILERKNGNFMHRSMPYAVRYVSDIEYRTMRKTHHFHVEDSCVGCGLCAKKCPARAIRIQEKQPVWVKSSCIMCLRCLHSCPKFAIQYGKNTKKHGQYRNPNVKI